MIAAGGRRGCSWRCAIINRTQAQARRAPDHRDVLKIAAMAGRGVGWCWISKPPEAWFPVVEGGLVSWSSSACRGLDHPAHRTGSAGTSTRSAERRGGEAGRSQPEPDQDRRVRLAPDAGVSGIIYSSNLTLSSNFQGGRRALRRAAASSAE